MASLVAEVMWTGAEHSDLNALLLGQGIHVDRQQGINHRPRETHRQERMRQRADTSRCFAPPSPSIQICSCPSRQAEPVFSSTQRPPHPLASGSPHHRHCLPPVAHLSLLGFFAYAHRYSPFDLSAHSLVSRRTSFHSLPVLHTRSQGLPGIGAALLTLAGLL